MNSFRLIYRKNPRRISCFLRKIYYKFSDLEELESMLIPERSLLLLYYFVERSR